MNRRTLKSPLDFKFTLDLGVDGSFDLKTFEEILEWLTKEEEAWSFLDGLSGDDAHIEDLRSARKWQKDALRLATEASLSFQEHGWLEDNADEALASARDCIHNAHESLPYSLSKVGRRARTLAKSSPAASAGYLFAHLWEERGIAPMDAGVLHGYMEGLKDRLKEFLDDKRTEFERLQRDFATAVERHGQEMKALRQAFEADKKLQAPVTFWESRRADHARESKSYVKWSFQAMAGLAAVLGIGLLLIWWKAPGDALPSQWMIGVWGVVAVLGVWAVRLLVRMYLSHQHLSTDAAERVAMVQTYLALMADNKLTSDEDRKLILQPLFRPATDGLVKDEVVPHPMLEILTRAQQRSD